MVHPGKAFEQALGQQSGTAPYFQGTLRSQFRDSGGQQGQEVFRHPVLDRGMLFIGRSGLFKAESDQLLIGNHRYR
jgi:hypothetical protein